MPLPPAALKVTPATHAMHTRSVDNVGAVVLANPTPQFVTGSHAFMPPTPNVSPSVQLRHTQFDVFDGRASGSFPAAHGTIALHAVWPASSWYCVVPSHATHGVAGFMSVSAVPKGQSVQLPYDPARVYVPAPQLTHGVSGSESTSLVPATHVMHMRSLVRVAATVWYWPGTHAGDRFSQKRLLVAVGAIISNCFAVHIVTFAHSVSSARLHWRAMYCVAEHASHGWHVRSSRW